MLSNYFFIFKCWWRIGKNFLSMFLLRLQKNLFFFTFLALLVAFFLFTKYLLQTFNVFLLLLELLLKLLFSFFNFLFVPIWTGIDLFKWRLNLRFMRDWGSILTHFDDVFWSLIFFFLFLATWNLFNNALFHKLIYFIKFFFSLLLSQS